MSCNHKESNGIDAALSRWKCLLLKMMSSSRASTRGRCVTRSKGRGTSASNEPHDENNHVVGSSLNTSPAGLSDLDATLDEDRNSDDLNLVLGAEGVSVGVKRRGIMRDANGKEILCISGTSFLSVSAPRTITELLQGFIRGAHIDWESVPLENKGYLWNKFTERYSWLDHSEGEVKCIWEKISREHISEIMYEARANATAKSGQKGLLASEVDWEKCKPFKPKWLLEDNWKDCCDKFKDPKWQKKCDRNKKNRNSSENGEVSKHTGRSISFAIHEARMTEENDGISPTPVAFFRHTHTTKKNGELIDTRSKVAHELYCASIEDQHGSDPSSDPNLDIEAWKEATQGWNKSRRAYGFGSSEVGTSIVNSSHSRTRFNSNKELQSLKRKVEESEERRMKEIEDLKSSMEEKHRIDMERLRVEVMKEMMTMIAHGSNPSS